MRRPKDGTTRIAPLCLGNQSPTSHPQELARCQYFATNSTKSNRARQPCMASSSSTFRLVWYNEPRSGARGAKISLAWCHSRFLPTRLLLKRIAAYDRLFQRLQPARSASNCIVNSRTVALSSSIAGTIRVPDGKTASDRGLAGRVSLSILDSSLV
jgi:hypothetical protein